MTWRLREIPMPNGRKLGELKPGDCWRVPLDADWDDIRYDELWRDRLSPQFRASGRDFVWQVCLPGGGYWSPDFLSSVSNQGWSLTGDRPENLTASPSINAVGSYHGWLQNGVLSDDCEGRTYG